MGHQVSVLTVNGHEVARPYESEHHLQLFLARVAVHVHLFDSAVINPGAVHEQPVYSLGDQGLVARNGRGGYYHGVTGYDFHVAVLAVGYPDERRGRLALAARGHDHHALVRQPGRVPRRHQNALGHVQVAHLQRHLYVVRHAAAHHGHLAVVFHGGIDHLLHSRDERRERGDHYAPRRLRYQPVECQAHHLLGLGVARHVGIGGVGKQQQRTIAGKP